MPSKSSRFILDDALHESAVGDFHERYRFKLSDLDNPDVGPFQVFYECGHFRPETEKCSSPEWWNVVTEFLADTLVPRDAN